MFRMKRVEVLIFYFLLIVWCVRPVDGDFLVSDVTHDDDDAHPNTLTETDADAPDRNIQTNRDIRDTSMETNWDEPDMRKDHYEDADWHPLTSFMETLTDLTPDAPLVIRNDNTGAEDGTNQTISNSSASECGEFSSQLMSNGQCRLTATLPPVGNSQKRCPDMFRCTDDVSYWLHENENRKEQLEELKETMSGLQEELRNHRHRVKALEMQVDFLLSTLRS